MKKKRRGFSFAEIVVALGIMGISVLAFSYLFSVNKKNVMISRDYTGAILLVQQTLEQCKAWDFERLDDEEAGNDSLEYDINNDSGTNDKIKPKVSMNGVEYDRIVEISSPKFDENKLKTIKVTLKWEKVNKKVGAAPSSAQNFKSYAVVSAVYDNR